MSELHSICRKAYQDAIARIPMHEDLRRSLKAHERVPKFIDNLAREFAKVKFEIKRDEIEKAVGEFTVWFVLAVDRMAAERNMSDMQKLTIQAKHEEQKAVQRLVDEADEKGVDHVTRDEKGNETIFSRTEI